MKRFTVGKAPEGNPAVFDYETGKVIGFTKLDNADAAAHMLNHGPHLAHCFRAYPGKFTMIDNNIVRVRLFGTDNENKTDSANHW